MLVSIIAALPGARRYPGSPTTQKDPRSNKHAINPFDIEDFVQVIHAVLLSTCTNRQSESLTCAMYSQCVPIAQPVPHWPQHHAHVGRIARGRHHQTCLIGSIDHGISRVCAPISRTCLISGLLLPPDGSRVGWHRALPPVAGDKILNGVWRMLPVNQQPVITGVAAISAI